MKTHLILLAILILFFIGCKKDASNPLQTPPQNTDTVATLYPGTALLDFMAHFQWSKWNPPATCQLKGDTIIIKSSFSLQVNSYSFEMQLRIPLDTGVILIDSSSVAFINYSRVLYGFAENYTTRDRLGSGKINVTYLSSSRKTIKGIFEGIVVLNLSTTQQTIAGGTFKATWK